MFERFTRDARDVVIQAQREARQLRSAEIGTEHLLLGLLAGEEGAGTAAGRVLDRLGVTYAAAEREVARAPSPHALGDTEAEALSAVGIDLDEVRQRVEDAFGPGALDRPARRGCRHLPFAASAKKALELSLREALALRHRHIDSGHLLLGLVRDQGNRGTALLRALGATPEAVRIAVIDELAHS